MLCQKCHQREATVHTTNYFAGAGPPQTPASMDLCIECFAEVDPKRAAVMKRPCRYCGGEFASHRTLPTANVADDQGEEISLCMRCEAEFNSFVEKMAPGFFNFVKHMATGTGPSMPTIEQIEALAGAASRVDAHMKQWVSQRTSNDTV